MKNSTKLMVGALLIVIGGALPVKISIIPLLAGGYLMGNVLHYLVDRERIEGRDSLLSSFLNNQKGK